MKYPKTLNERFSKDDFYLFCLELVKNDKISYDDLINDLKVIHKKRLLKLKRGW